MTATCAFDPLAILGALHRRDVHFVIIGGIAAYILGAYAPSANLDICGAPDLDNLRKLALALNDIKAQRRGSQSEVPEIVDEHQLGTGGVFTFSTD